MNCIFSTNLLKVVWIYRFQTNCFDKIVFTSCIFKPAISRIVQIVQQQLCCCVVFEYQEWELCCCKLYNCCVKLYLRQAWNTSLKTGKRPKSFQKCKFLKKVPFWQFSNLELFEVIFECFTSFLCFVLSSVGFSSIIMA